ncbi:hypothetical protein Q5752_006148 [Cryptotrichosporon argae]
MAKPRPSWSGALVSTVRVVGAAFLIWALVAQFVALADDFENYGAGSSSMGTASASSPASAASTMLSIYVSTATDGAQNVRRRNARAGAGRALAGSVAKRDGYTSASVPTHAGGIFFVLVSRIMLALAALVLVPAQLGVPEDLLAQHAPVLGPASTPLALGLAQLVIAVENLRVPARTICLVPTWALFVLGPVHILFASAFIFRTRRRPAYPPPALVFSRAHRLLFWTALPAVYASVHPIDLDPETARTGLRARARDGRGKKRQSRPGPLNLAPAPARPRQLEHDSLPPHRDVGKGGYPTFSGAALGAAGTQVPSGTLEDTIKGRPIRFVPASEKLAWAQTAAPAPRAPGPPTSTTSASEKTPLKSAMRTRPAPALLDKQTQSQPATQPSRAARPDVAQPPVSTPATASNMPARLARSLSRQDSAAQALERLARPPRLPARSDTAHVAGAQMDSAFPAPPGLPGVTYPALPAYMSGKDTSDGSSKTARDSKALRSTVAVKRNQSVRSARSTREVRFRISKEIVEDDEDEQASGGEGGGGNMAVTPDTPVVGDAINSSHTRRLEAAAVPGKSPARKSRTPSLVPRGRPRQSAPHGLYIDFEATDTTVAAAIEAETGVDTSSDEDSLAIAADTGNAHDAPDRLSDAESAASHAGAETTVRTSHRSPRQAAASESPPRSAVQTSATSPALGSPAARPESVVSSSDGEGDETPRARADMAGLPRRASTVGQVLGGQYLSGDRENRWSLR